MRYEGAGFLGQVSFITGPGKDSGKTAFMNRAAFLARRAAREAGLPPPALLTAGYDGDTRDFLSGARKPSVPVEAGDLFVSAERFLREGGSSPEILDAAPGRSALGRLCVARAHRAGAVALVGPGSNAQLDWLLARVVDEGLCSCALVDGAVNRITPLAGRPDATLIYSLRVDRAGLESALAKIRRMALLMDLPLAAEPAAQRGDGPPAARAKDGAVTAAAGVYALEGALTADTLSLVPKEARTLAIDDFTKVFLDYAALKALLRERSLQVRRRPRFRGFSLITRGLPDSLALERLKGLTILGLPIEGYLGFNPYGESAQGGAGQ